jgi:hypothetical protein
MFYTLLGAAWFLLTTVLAAFMWASQVGPDDAATNLTLWAKKVGIENPPEWLREKAANRAVRNFVAAGLAFLLLSGSFVGGFALNDYLREQMAPEVRMSNRWEPLSPPERRSLRNDLRIWSPERLNVLCAIPACADLAESIYEVLQELKWKGGYQPTYFMDQEGVRRGIELWSYPTRGQARDYIAVALERATNGRLKVATQPWEVQPSPENEPEINLVIGRVR